MSGVFPDAIAAPFQIGAPLRSSPPPTFGESFDAGFADQARIENFAAVRGALSDRYDRIGDALRVPGEALDPRLVNPYKRRPLAGGPSDDEAIGTFWEAVNGLPAERKALLQDLPQNREALEADARTELQPIHEAGRRAEGLGAFAGRAAASLTDPVTLLSMGLGAPPGAGVARTIVIEGLANALGEAATLPSTAAGREFVGDKLTAGEAVVDVLAAAGLGAGVAGVIAGAAKGGPVAGRALSRALASLSDRDLSRVFRAVVKRPGRTEDTAAGVLDREAETLETAPDRSTTAGVTQHADRLRATESAVIEGGPLPRDPVSPAAAAAPPGTISPRDWDFLVRTIAGEAASESETGQQAVARVVMNRLATGRWGDTVESVVTARGQFEPWNREDRRAWMQGLTPDSPEYRRAAAAARAAVERPDPSFGWLNFLNPEIVRGRRPDGALPELDRPGRQIGRHWFWGSPAGEAPPRVYRAPVERFDPADIRTDAEAYQFKAGGDAAGVTDRLQGVARWDDVKAGTLLLHERLDGSLYVADGHQRLGLAQRLRESDETLRIDARVLRESEGVTVADARAIAAAKNIAEGTGTAVDAAKILRGRPDLAAGLPPRSGLVRTANELARLGDEPFGMVINGVVPPEQAAIAARAAADEAVQAGLMRLLAKAQPETEREARALIDEAVKAGFTRGTQQSLFGDTEIADSLIVERAKIRDRAVRQLGRDRRVFETLSREAGRIREAGNILQETANARRAQTAAQAEQILERLANRTGPVGDALGAAARRARDSGRIGPATDDFVRALRAVLDDPAELRRLLTEPGGAGRALSGELGDGAAAGRGRGAGPAGEADGGLLRLPEPETLTSFDRPAGPGQAAQAAELEADLARAEAAPAADPETAALARQVAAENAADDEFAQQLDLICGPRK